MNQVDFKDVSIRTYAADESDVIEYKKSCINITLGQTLFHVNWSKENGDFNCGYGWPSLAEALHYAFTHQVQ